MTDLERRHLKMLADVRARTHGDATRYDVALEDFVLELRDTGVSTRRLAEALDVGTSTIQGWIANARRRRPPA